MFEGFRSRHSNLTIRIPQSLSYNLATCANEETIEDFFAKLCGVYNRLNLLSKPMQIFNIDETGVSVVHKVGKVVAEVGRRVRSITSGEREKTHTYSSYLHISQWICLTSLFDIRTLERKQSQRILKKERYQELCSKVQKVVG